VRLCVERLWDGGAADERYSLELSFDGFSRELVVRTDAPFFGDPAPAAPAGSVANLYEYEVVELFVFGAGARYLELELGPHGHYLALTFAGVRRRLESLAVRYEAEVRGGARWYGIARVPVQALPPGAVGVNAHAIHGRGPLRRWLSASPAPGARPDFHRPKSAIALEPALSAQLGAAYKSLEPPG